MEPDGQYDSSLIPDLIRKERGGGKGRKRRGKDTT